MPETKMQAAYAVAKVNNVDILVIENEEKRVAIAPICNALGIDVESQKKRILRDPILGSTTVMMTGVATDKKEREMFTIPFKFVFGWLFSIDESKVHEDAREAVIRYKLECYNALYNHFSAYKEFIEKRQVMIDEKIDLVEKLRSEMSDAKDKLDEAKKELAKAREFSFADYTTEQLQLTINFDNQIQQ